MQLLSPICVLLLSHVIFSLTKAQLQQQQQPPPPPQPPLAPSLIQPVPPPPVPPILSPVAPAAALPETPASSLASPAPPPPPPPTTLAQPIAAPSVQPAPTSAPAPAPAPAQATTSPPPTTVASATTTTITTAAAATLSTTAPAATTPAPIATTAVAAVTPIAATAATTTTTTTTTTPAPKQQLPFSSNRGRSQESASSSGGGGGPANIPFQRLRPKLRFKCDKDLDCLNAGVCISGNCFCHPGFSGESCAINIDECRQVEEACANNGTCVDEINSYRCECAPGFKGDRCQESVDMCSGLPCQNGARCVNHRTDYTCECEPGWEGRHCELNINECLVRSPCQNNATCFDLVNDYRCECGQSGFTGKNCELEIDDCAQRPCAEGAKECVDLVADFKCVCHDGFAGKRCEIDIDECQTNPCQNNATCMEKSYHLRLMRESGATSAQAYHELTMGGIGGGGGGGGLDQGSPLAMGEGAGNLSMYAGFTCNCTEEFFGDTCEERKGCYTKPHGELCNHHPNAECVSLGSSYECHLSASVDGTGHNYAAYRVLTGGGRQSISKIYVKFRSYAGGVIMSFETIQPNHQPQSQPQHDQSSPSLASSASLPATTTTTTTSFTDLYLNSSGLFLGGSQIIKTDESISLKGLESELLDGSEREFRFELDKPLEISGLTLARQASPSAALLNDGQPLLPPFKGCLMQVRVNNQLIPMIDYDFGAANGGNSNASFQLELTKNQLKADGQCRTCFDKYCLHEGTCGDDGNDHCVCPSTYTGTFCDLDVNECKSDQNSCVKGQGICENLDGGYKCNCKEGFKGKNCEEIADYCKAKQPCVNGICKNLDSGQGKYHCECPSSHVGKKCDRKRDCSPGDCHREHAQCVNNVTCACLPGHREERIMCEYVDSCEQIDGELCLNGGQCKNLDHGGYHCVCPEPFYGPICQYLIEKPQFDIILLIVIICVGFLVAACAIVSLVIFRSVRKARATRGTYSPSTQEKFGNSASDLLKPPQQERLI